MDLHADRDAFETLLLSLSERSTIRADILEKDYYVTLLLAELSSNGAGQTNESILGFDYFHSGWTNAAFESAYSHMQSVYVFSEEYYISIDILIERLLGLRHRFEQLRL